eukprot:scaffold121459_cov71-Phaeocystis_antarctica.AAC.1
MRVIYSQRAPIQRTDSSKTQAPRLRGSLMKTRNWLRPRARFFAVHKVSLLRSAARRACSSPSRCKLLQSSWIVPSPSGRTCYCCSLTRSLVASLADPCHGCRDVYLHWGMTPSRGMLLWATTAVLTRPHYTAAGLSAQGRI